MNDGPNDAQYGLNKFADMTTEEFQNMLGLKPIALEDRPLLEYPQSGLLTPEAIDWRERGVVNPVRD